MKFEDDFRNKKKVVFLVVFFLIMGPMVRLLMAEWLDWRTVEKELVRTNSGDEYIFQFTTSISHYASCQILDAQNKKLLADFFVKLPAKPPVKVLIDTSQLRCYEVGYSIIYQMDNKFDSIEQSEVKDQDPKNLPGLVIVGKTLIAEKQWKWLDVFGDFLVRANDEETILILKRYSKGQFFSEEIDMNNNSGITQQHIQDLSKRILLDNTKP